MYQITFSLNYKIRLKLHEIFTSSFLLKYDQKQWYKRAIDTGLSNPGTSVQHS